MSMQESFPPVRCPLGLRPSAIKIKDVELRLVVIEFDNGAGPNTGYVIQSEQQKVPYDVEVEIRKLITGKYGGDTYFWNNHIDKLTRNYRVAEEWKWK